MEQSVAIAALKEQQKNTDNYLQTMSKKIDLLIDSDKDDIKSYITK